MNESEIDGVRSKKNPFLFLKNKYQFLYHSVPTKKGGSIASTKSNKGLFGASLEDALVECGSVTSSGLYVPDPICRCANEIIKRGLKVEGIFRLSGAASEVEQLWQTFDASTVYHDKHVDLSNYDIHAIAGAMKKYLRCLPEPAIPITYHRRFIQQLEQEQHADQQMMSIVADLVTSLPRAHFHLIMFIIELASHIQQYQHINMMNPEALAVVLAPVCTGLDHRLKDVPAFAAIHNHNKKKPCPPPAAAALDQLVQANAQWTHIWTLMIEHHQFLLDKWLSNNTLSNTTTTIASIRKSNDHTQSHYNNRYQHYNQSLYTPSTIAATTAASQHSIMVAVPQHNHQRASPRSPLAPSPQTLPISTCPSLSADQKQYQQQQQQQQRKRPKSYGVVVMRRGKCPSPPLKKPTATSIDDLDHYLLDSAPILSSILHMTKENSCDRRRRTRSMFSPKIPPLV